MSNRYDNKWVQQIVDLQHEDGRAVLSSRNGAAYDGANVVRKVHKIRADYKGLVGR